MLLEIENLTKSYSGPDGRVPVLQGISLSLDAGETLALTGESGSGKSTLLHLIGGLDQADGGRILVGGQEVTALDDAGRAALRRGMVGLIFQQFNLIPSLTVRDNIRFQARLAGREDPAWAAALTEALGLTEQLAKYPEDLSGGQQQRVAIARTLAARPALILADEPTGNLDEDTADRVMDQLTRLVDEAGATLVLVTHSSALASRMGRQCHLSHGRLT
jgi:putative ABC transport system ATP-binding protein